MARSTIDSRVGSATAALGLVLAGPVVGTWLAVHVSAIFLVDWTATWLWLAAPVVVALQCWLSVGLFIVISLLTCFFFGYHHEHHDAPWVPWWELPAQRRSTINPEYPEVENG